MKVLVDLEGETEMTDEQIINALECCADTKLSSCHECPVRPADGTVCIERLCSYALALIKLHRERIVALRVLYDNECKQSGEARAEAIREFAERLWDKKITYNGIRFVVFDTIAATENEMREEQK